jgi:hypothetical protein
VSIIGVIGSNFYEDRSLAILLKDLKTFSTNLKTLRLLEKFEDKRGTRLRNREAARREDEDSETWRFLKKLKVRKVSRLKAKLGLWGTTILRPVRLEDCITRTREDLKTDSLRIRRLGDLKTLLVSLED